MRKNLFRNRIVLTTAIVVVMIGTLIGCGKSENDDTPDSPIKETRMPTASETTGSMTEPKVSVTATAGASELSYLDVGFYSQDKEEVANQLKSFPNEYATEEEAMRAGVLMVKLKISEEAKAKNDAMWLDFVRRTKEAKAQRKKYRQAFLSLNYTVEGDAIYTYILFDNGTYYVMMDSSRDQFGSPDDAYIEYRNAKLTTEKGEGEDILYQLGKGESGFFYTVTG